MPPDASTQQSIDRLRSMLREVSLIQANQYFGESDVKLVAHPQDHRLGQVLTRYIAMVLLTGDDLRMVFKVHFNPEQVRAFRKSKGVADADLDDRQLIDYMKELSNQMAGRVCRVCDAHQISMGMSVPLCTRGIYEIYADYQPKTGAVTKFGDFWQLDGAFKTLYCSCYVELISKVDFSAIQHSDAQSEEGELDFL